MVRIFWGLGIKHEKLFIMGAATTELIRFADVVDRKNREYFELVRYTTSVLELSSDANHWRKYNSWQKAIGQYEAFKDFASANESEALTTILFTYQRESKFQNNGMSELTFEISIDNKVLFVEGNRIAGSFPNADDALNFVFETTAERVSNEHSHYLSEKG